MKGIYLGLALAALFVSLAAACQRSENANTNSSANQNMTNQNGMMASNQKMPEMTDQMKSDPNAASQPYDLQFIDTMTTHHQGAIVMAEIALKRTSNAELKKFAQKIIDDQNKEISQMKGWRGKWYPGKPRSMNMEMPGMMDSMMMMTGSGMKKMESSTGKDFDLMFLDMMTPHHAGAVEMAKEALSKAEHNEIKTLARNIINAQEAEIKEMADWKLKWSK